MNLMDELGLQVDAEQLAEESVAHINRPMDMIPAGVHKATIDKMYIREAEESEALMLEVVFDMPDFLDDDGLPRKIYYSTCVRSGTNKGKKSTYTDKKSGKERNLPGVTEMNMIVVAATGLDTTPVMKGQTQHKEETIDATIFTEMQGLPLVLGVKHEENFWNGEVTLRYMISAFLNKDGENAEGENLVENLKARIEKNPIKKLKNQQATSGGSTSGTQGPSGETIPSTW